jgi:creatinine amidohydrolase
MNLNPSTLGRVIADLAETLASSGVHKLVLLNGHGGNDLKWLLRELYGSSKLHIFLCNWYQIAADRHGDLFEEAGDHAGELETSMGLFLFPRLVAKDRADSAAPRRCRFEAVRQGWVQITRPWHLLTPHSGVGDPTAASAQKGEELTRIVVERLAGFLAELSESPLDDTFPL